MPIENAFARVRLHRIRAGAGLRLPSILAACGLALGAGAASYAPASSGAAAAPDPSADSLTVAQCVALARAAAPEVRAGTQEHLAARFDSLAASRNRVPSVSVFGDVFVSPGWSYDPVLTDLGNYALKLGLSTPLLDAGERARARRQAALAAATALADLERSGRDAGVRAAALALGLLRQREIEDANRESLAWLERLSTLIESAVRSGARDRADLERVAIEHDAVAGELLSAAQVRAELERELAVLTGGRSLHAAIAAGSAAERDAPPAAADSAALLGRVAESPEVRAAVIAENSARLALDEARKQNALRVDLTLDAGFFGSDLTRAVPEELLLTHPGATLRDRLRRDLGASLTLDFRHPLLDPAVRPTIAAREAARAAAGARAATATDERRRAMLDLLGRWSAAAAKLDLARGARNRAEDHLLRLRSLYAGGASSLIELLDARRQLDDARTRLADARLELRSAHWEGELQR